VIELLINFFFRYHNFFFGGTGLKLDKVVQLNGHLLGKYCHRCDRVLHPMPPSKEQLSSLYKSKTVQNCSSCELPLLPPVVIEVSLFRLFTAFYSFVREN
jgi:hypothetical protein